MSLTKVRQDNTIGIIFDNIAAMKLYAANSGDYCVIKSDDSSFKFTSGNATCDELVNFLGVDGYWTRLGFDGDLSVEQAGYISGDVAPFINSINSHGYNAVVSGNYDAETTITIDIAKGCIKSDGAIIKDTGANGTPLLHIVSSSDYTSRDTVNSNAHITGISFEGTGERPILLGDGDASHTGEVSELLIDRCGFVGTRGVEFGTSSYRILFSKCALSRSFHKTISFKNSPNSGEVIRFSHCWIVDNGGELALGGGQFIFDSCSLPAGQKAGWFAPTMMISDNGHVTIESSNIEFQPSQSFPAAVVSGAGRLTIRDTTLLCPTGYSAVPIVNNEGGIVQLEQVSLPLYDSINMATGSAARQVVGGDSKYVTSRGCYPRAGFIKQNWNLGNIVSASLNNIGNPSATQGPGPCWTVTTVGSGTNTIEAVSDVPTDIMYNRSFHITTQANRGVVFSQELNTPIEIGRFYQFGFWAKNVSGKLLAKIKFLQVDGGLVREDAYYVPVANSWGFYAVSDAVPAGS